MLQIPFKSASELQRTTKLQASCIGKGNRMKFSLQQVIATAKGNKDQQSTRMTITMSQHDIFRTFSERRYKSWRQSTTQWGCQACRLSSYVKLANLVNLSYPSDHRMRQYHANSSVVLKLVSIHLSVWTIKFWIRFLAFLWSSKGWKCLPKILLFLICPLLEPFAPRKSTEEFGLWAPLSFLFLPYKFINWCVSSSRGILSWTSEKWWKMVKNEFELSFAADLGTVRAVHMFLATAGLGAEEQLLCQAGSTLFRHGRIQA